MTDSSDLEAGVGNDTEEQEPLLETMDRVTEKTKPVELEPTVRDTAQYKCGCIALRSSKRLRVVSWNLSTQWVDSSGRLCESKQNSLLGDSQRAPIILDVLTKKHPGDVILLTGVDDSTHSELVNGLPDHKVLSLIHNGKQQQQQQQQHQQQQPMSLHEVHEEVTPIPTGSVAIFRNDFALDLTQESVQLNGDGNTAVLVRGTMVKTNHRFSVLISDLSGRSSEARSSQISSALKTLTDKGVLSDPEEILLWGGLFNAAKDSPTLRPIMNAGLSSASSPNPASSTTNKRRLPQATSSYTSAYMGVVDHPVDHIFFRGPKEVLSVLPHRAISSHRWVLENRVQGGSRDPGVIEPLIDWTLDNYGSVHMPVGGTLLVS